jgi:membrane-associated phospholipid phosphatase
MVFLVVAFVLALPALWAQLRMEKLALHTAVNMHHTAWGDKVFPYATHVADGLTATFIALLLLVLHSWRAFLMVGLSVGGSALITQFLKQVVFPGMDRPAMFRDRLGEMTWVQGVELNHHFSFPSGHSTAAFSMCLALAVIIGSPRWAALLAVLATLLAFSRVYLSQHFMQDVTVGAIIGMATAIGMYLWLYRGKVSTRKRLDGTPFRRQNQ